MSKGHVERLLLAENDYAAALSFRAVAEEAMKLRERAVELYEAVDGDVPTAAEAALESAHSEYNQLNRICLRLSARRFDASLRAEGLTSDWESATILWDIKHPVLAD